MASLAHVSSGRVRYGAFGAVIGLLAPIAAMFLGLLEGRSMVEIHADPLMWIIDTVPLLLAVSASIAGAREDRLAATHEETRARLADFEMAATALESALTSSEERGEALERTRAELDRFAKVCAHDLAAPLVGMKSLSEWIREELDEDAPGQSLEHLTRLEQRIDRMQSLVRRIEEFASAGRGTHASEVVVTGRLVQEVFEQIAGHERFTLSLDRMPPMETARKPLRAVFVALLRNAIQHHDLASGTITVSATIAHPFCEFTVLDDGPGIADKFRSKVFELFVTLKRRDEHEASGAGLAIAKKIVEAEGGTVRVEPREGRGTAIRFTWPLRREFERGELDSVAKKSIAEVRDKRKTLSGLYEL